MSSRFKLLENFKYLNMSGTIVRGRKGAVAVLPRRSDIKKGLAEKLIEPADAATRASHTMTSKNITSNNEEKAPVLFEETDFVAFVYEEEEVTGEVRNVTSRGILDVDIGSAEEEKVVRVNPEEVKVEKL